MVSPLFPPIILPHPIYWPSILEFFLPATSRPNITSLGSMISYHMIMFICHHPLIFYCTCYANIYLYITPSVHFILLFIQARALLEMILDLCWTGPITIPGRNQCSKSMVHIRERMNLRIRAGFENWL